MQTRSDIEEEFLVLPRCVFASVGSPLFVDQNAIAFGLLQPVVCGPRRRWLLRRVELRAALPRGDAEPPLISFALLVPPGLAAGRSAAELAKQVAPRMNQRVIVLVLGLGDTGEHWDGVMIEQHQQRQLSGFQIVESQLPTAHRSDADAHSVSAVELNEDFSRLAGATSVTCVQAIRNTHIAVVGAGRNGSRIVHLLAGAGFGRIDIIDGDHIESSNLDAMDCVIHRDVGHSKANRVARFANQLRPTQIVLGSISTPVTSEAAISAIRRCDIVITAVDSDTPRLFVSLLAARYLHPHLDVACGAVNTPTGRRLAGDIRFLLPGDGCLHCTAGGLPDESNSRRELLASPRAVPQKPPASWQQQGDRAGSLATLNSITCGIGVQLIIDFLNEPDSLNHSFWQRFEWRPGKGLESIASHVTAHADCEICRMFR
jgi:molybdopterin/thiamine biosynthesis adenylyltransferase